MSILKSLHRSISSDELKKKELELERLRFRMDELMNWCAKDSPEIGHAMIYLDRGDQCVSVFRDDLRNQMLTFNNFVKKINEPK